MVLSLGKTNVSILLSKKPMRRSQLEYILAVAQHRSFSKAAAACFVTQSTLSALVAKYEQEIDIMLFDRKTKPISITPQGEKILRHLHSIKREFQLLDEVVSEIKGYEAGQLRLACIPTVAPYLFPLILNKLSAAYPKVNFHIHEITTERIIEELQAGNIDVGIVSTPLEKRDLREYPLYYEDFLLYDCGQQDSSPTTYRVADIDLDRLWLLEEGHCLRNQVGKICELRQHKRVKGNLTYSCGSIYSLIEMVKQNAGLTLLPRLALANNPHIDGDLLHPLSPPVPTREIGLVTHQNFVKDRFIEQLSALIRQAVQPFLPDTLAPDSRVAPFA
jgi:LysR family hydrogen peroxide-inducible transcriptional activator